MCQALLCPRDTHVVYARVHISYMLICQVLLCPREHREASSAAHSRQVLSLLALPLVQEVLSLLALLVQRCPVYLLYRYKSEHIDAHSRQIVGDSDHLTLPRVLMPYALCLMSYALRLAPYAFFLVADSGRQRPPRAPPRLYVLCLIPCALCLAPYALFLVADCWRQRPPHAAARAYLLAACWLQEFVGCCELLACWLPLESA
jgi:hypothetical protein